MQRCKFGNDQPAGECLGALARGRAIVEAGGMISAGHRGLRGLVRAPLSDLLNRSTGNSRLSMMWRDTAFNTALSGLSMDQVQQIRKVFNVDIVPLGGCFTSA